MMLKEMERLREEELRQQVEKQMRAKQLVAEVLPSRQSGVWNAWLRPQHCLRACAIETAIHRATLVVKHTATFHFWDHCKARCDAAGGASPGRMSDTSVWTGVRTWWRRSDTSVCHMSAQVLEANQEQIERKKVMQQLELEEDARIADYNQQKQMREAAIAEEKARIAREKEAECARLRAAQEKVADKQSELDELRARRHAEAVEREWREKESAKAARNKVRPVQCRAWCVPSALAPCG